MTEGKVESLIRVQQSICETLDIHGELYDRQREQLHKIQEDLTRVQEQVQKLYVIHYPPKPASSCRR